MKISADEIASVIQQEIAQFESEIDVKEVGTVLEVGDGIARVHGLTNVAAGEMVEFPGGIIGLAFNLEENSVGIIILGDYLLDQRRRSSQIAGHAACRFPSVTPSSDVFSIRWEIRSMAKARSTPANHGPSKSSLPVWPNDSRSASRCRPASKRSMQ